MNKKILRKDETRMNRRRFKKNSCNVEQFGVVHFGNGVNLENLDAYMPLGTFAHVVGDFAYLFRPVKNK